MITPQLYALFLCHRSTTNPKESVVIPSTHTATTQNKRAETTFINTRYVILSLISQSKQQEIKDTILQVKTQHLKNIHDISPKLPQPILITKPSIIIHYENYPGHDT